MSGSSAPQVLERPGTERDTASPGAPLIGVGRPAPAVADTPGSASGAVDAADPTGRPRARRLPHPPGRRAHLWLAALIAGAVLAAAPNLTRPAGQLTGSAADYGIGVAADLGLSGGIDDAGVRRSITEAEAQVRLGELAASRAAREPDFALPLAGRETTCFCMRWGQFHPGLDIAAPLGTDIVAASDGVVLQAGRASGFGYAIYLQDAEGNVQIYGHMRYLNVEAGQVVRAGDLIAWVGNEGFSTGPHLHFEIHRGKKGGQAIDPADWFAERGVPYPA